MGTLVLLKGLKHGTPPNVEFITDQFGVCVINDQHDPADFRWLQRFNELEKLLIQFKAAVVHKLDHEPFIVRANCRLTVS